MLEVPVSLSVVLVEAGCADMRASRGMGAVMPSKLKCGGAAYKKGGAVKDACYQKVKSQYKVFPSAYASGAIAKCRKKGSKS